MDTEPNESNSDLYAMFAPEPNADISLTITAHRGGGGGYGSGGVFICDTMSTEIHGAARRPMTENERTALNEAARQIARILVAIRT